MNQGKEVKIYIDGRQYTAQVERPLLEVALEAGIDIPHLCYHPAFSPYGACRLCLVREVETGRILASCTLPVREGLSVISEDEELFHLRRTLLELLAAMAPRAKGLSELYERYQVNPTRFFRREPQNTCILCGCCVRVCNEVLKRGVLELAFRSIQTKVATAFLEPSSECIGCLACESLCPTGAISALYTEEKLTIEGLYGTSHRIVHCKECGKPLATEGQIRALDRDLEELCPSCRRRQEANRWASLP